MKGYIQKTEDIQISSHLLLSIEQILNNYEKGFKRYTLKKLIS